MFSVFHGTVKVSHHLVASRKRFHNRALWRRFGLQQFSGGARYRQGRA